MIIISKKETGGIVPPLRSGWQKTHRQHLDYDPERVKINIAVAVKPVFKYQGLRSLPWGVRRSLLRRIPGFGSANLLRQIATVFFLRADLGQAHPPHLLLADDTVGPVLVAQRLVLRANVGMLAGTSVVSRLTILRFPWLLIVKPILPPVIVRSTEDLLFPLPRRTRRPTFPSSGRKTAASLALIASPNCELGLRCTPGSPLSKFFHALSRP